MTPGPGGTAPGQDANPVPVPGSHAEQTPARRPRRRAVRPGSGEPDPPVALRSQDDSDVGWPAAREDSDDDRLRRDVPPHW